MKKLIVFALAAFLLTSCSGSKSDKGTDSTSSDSATKQAKIGDVIKTDYFEIVANKVTLTPKINTGNEFLDVKADPGTQFIVINCTFKNTDNESRMAIDGSVFLISNGKEYEFDKSEAVMADGYGLFLEQINPLLSKTTNLVYKVPVGEKGAVYWQPGRSDERIYLGDF